QHRTGPKRRSSGSSSSSLLRVFTSPAQPPEGAPDVGLTDNLVRGYVPFTRLSTTMPVSIYSGMAHPRQPNARLVPAPGDELCVAFANTRYWRGGAPAVEMLNGLGDVLAWCAQVKSIDANTVTTIEAWANRHGTEAARL